ncbi:MAG: hypothetical protein SCARUB_05073, partial [Candidatus Scalindua rubra]
MTYKNNAKKREGYLYQYSGLYKVVRIAHIDYNYSEKPVSIGILRHFYID